MSAYEDIVEGLNEAIAFAKGKDTGAKVHQIAVPVAAGNEFGGFSTCHGNSEPEGGESAKKDG